MSEKQPECEGKYSQVEALRRAFNRVIDGEIVAWPDLEKAFRRQFLDGLELIRRDLAEDALQEALLMITRNPSRFQKVQRPESYFFRVSRRILFRLMRREGANKQLSSELRQHDAEAPGPSAIERLIESEQLDQLLQAIVHLTERYYSVIYMHWFERKSLEEISRILNEPPATIRTWHCRAKEQLERSLRREK